MALDLEQLKHNVIRKGTSAAGSVVKHFLHWFGLPIIAPVVALMDIWDYMLARNRLTEEYGKEIAAKMGKPVEDVTAEDMKAVAKENPTIDQAYSRNKTKRNMDLVINVGCTIAVFVILATLISTTAPLAVVLFSGAVGMAGYWAATSILGKIGSKILGLSEPSLKKVDHNPALQEKLCVSSQVTFLEHQQKKGIEITSNQISTLYHAAGTPITRQESQEWADKLNGGVYDATELAFAVCDQESGVLPRASRGPSHLDMARERLKNVGGVVMDKAGVVKDRTTDFAGTVASSVKDRSADLGSKASNLWQTKVRRHHDPSQSFADSVQTERQQQSQVTTPSL